MSAQTQILRLHNTLTRRVEPFTPADPESVTFYTCGPTVYDDAHIGNFRSFLAADVLRRWIECPLCAVQTASGAAHKGPRRVTHVMNITDVGHMTDDDQADGGGEDKMAVAGKRLEEAKKSGKLPPDAGVDPTNPYDIARFYETRFLEDARRLGLRVAIEQQDDPSLMPRATDSIEGMKRMIEALGEKGFAYAAGEPGARAAYFDVQKYASYGELSGNTLDNLRGGAGGRVSDAHQQEKRHPADFLLWKEDASHVMKWQGPTVAGVPLGEGYPGWHIECSVMSLGRLDPSLERGEIDLHSGGEDNIFPHHECERAQTCGFTGNDRFARMWFHPRFLLFEGEKMSKSKGTFYTARQLFEKGIEPAAVRLELIKTHYRANADFSFEGLKASQRSINRWRKDARSLMFQIADPKLPANFDWPIHERLGEFADALSSDLNIAMAIAVLNTESALEYSPEDAPNAQEAFTESAALQQLPHEPMDAAAAHAQTHDESRPDCERALAAVHLIDHVLGVIFQPPVETQSFEIGVFLPGVEASAEVESLLVERAEARKNKDYARSDAIRDELAAKGYAIKDVAGGRVEVGPA